jgi:ribosome modulation factor
MAIDDKERPSLLIRTAVWFGGAFGKWQRSRAAARDDSFVEKWKAAWNEGCAAHKAGKSQRDVPYTRAPGKEAWLAGWAWAKQQANSDRILH